MTCRCKYEFCHTCGSRWKSGCTTQGGCGGTWRGEPLWSEARPAITSTTGKSTILGIPERFMFRKRTPSSACARPTVDSAAMEQARRMVWRERVRARLSRVFHASHATVA